MKSLLSFFQLAGTTRPKFATNKNHKKNSEQKLRHKLELLHAKSKPIENFAMPLPLPLPKFSKLRLELNTRLLELPTNQKKVILVSFKK